MTSQEAPATGSIEFRQVSKKFAAVDALVDLNLDIRPGEFVTLLGPSGSGKSTTLNLLAGLLTPDHGDVLISGRVVNRLSPNERDIAMVFQNYALYPHMTVYENLAFPLRAPRHRKPADQIDKLVKDVAQSLGIEALLQRFPKEISGGQQQRVALGRALIRGPKVLLLDEPLSNLDARLRIRMRHEMKALHQRLAPTIVYVTHDQAEAMSLSDRIAVFNGGRLQQYAAPDQIYSRPTNLFVANFVGEREINRFEGRLSTHGDAVSFDTDGASFSLELAIASIQDLVGRDLILGFRAEDAIVDLHDRRPGPMGVVTLVESSGADRIVYLTIGEKEIWCRCAPSLGAAVGQTLTVTLVANMVMLFDPATSMTEFAAGERCFQPGSPATGSHGAAKDRFDRA